MHYTKRGSWRGLYALLPLAGGLLYLAYRVQVEEVWHTLLLGGVVMIIGSLAWHWSETHADLMASEGVDAQAGEDTLAAGGIQPGRYAPSLSTTQAQYRLVMFGRQAVQTPETTDQPSTRKR
jgi:hypothetical protein